MRARARARACVRACFGACVRALARAGAHARVSSARTHEHARAYMHTDIEAGRIRGRLTF